MYIFERNAEKAHRIQQTQSGASVARELLKLILGATVQQNRPQLRHELQLHT